MKSEIIDLTPEEILIRAIKDVILARKKIGVSVRFERIPSREFRR